MFENDYIMRQIKSMVQLMSMLIFGKSIPLYEKQDAESPTQGDLLHDRLIDLLGKNRIDEAENLLFEQLESGVDGGVRVALDFYYRLSEMPDERLAEVGFSREEIDMGVRDALEICGVAVPEDRGG
ncbi:MAG: hypothetical protein GX647_11650 [Clostridiales bacterium]|jgi:hypothetical protein|nr:hypothetical protein [Clostridiales bacterium]OPZ67680.1 MAG: hypothetical protein BWY81_01198 [Firmicutes bacterium ADurb.Bin467]